MLVEIWLVAYVKMLKLKEESSNMGSFDLKTDELIFESLLYNDLIN